LAHLAIRSSRLDARKAQLFGDLLTGLPRKRYERTCHGQAIHCLAFGMGIPEFQADRDGRSMRRSCLFGSAHFMQDDSAVGQDDPFEVALADLATPAQKP